MGGKWLWLAALVSVGCGCRTSKVWLSPGYHWVQSLARLGRRFGSSVAQEARRDEAPLRLASARSDVVVAVVCAPLETPQS